MLYLCRVDRNKFIETLANDKELKTICRNITHNNELYEDLFQHSLLAIYQVKEETLINLTENKKERHYFVKLALNEWRNPRSDFNKLYSSQTFRKEDLVYTSDSTPTDVCKFDIDQTLKYFKTITPETIQATKTLERLRKEDNSTGSGFPYRTELFKLYLEHGSFRKVEAEIDVIHMSIYKTVKGVKEEIKKR